MIQGSESSLMRNGVDDSVHLPHTEVRMSGGSPVNVHRFRRFLSQGGAEWSIPDADRFSLAGRIFRI